MMGGGATGDEGTGVKRRGATGAVGDKGNERRG